MRNQLFNKRIPTVLGIGFVILGVILTSIIVKTQTSLRSTASISEEPRNVKITNISDESFTITYQTDMSTTGSVNFGKDKKLGNTELEDLDKEKGNLSPKNIHSITIKKLLPTTKYYLAITSGQNTFLNNGNPFEVSTGPNIVSASALQNTIKGKVILPDGNPPTEAIAYLNTKDSQTISTIVAKDGSFNFSLKSLRSSDLSSYINLEEDAILKLLIINSSLKSDIITSLDQATSIPIITLSNNYDFILENDLPVASKSAESLGFPSISTKPEGLKPEILTPKKDQSFTDQKPQFRGKSLPNEKVEIIIHSDEQITTQVTADGNGNWTYRPPTNLSPGDHTITIKTRDQSGILTTLIQSFTVFAQGSQVSESATPSATPTIKITPTTIPTPTTILTPTFTPTPFPTLAPISTKGGLPPTGGSPIELLTISAIVAFMASVILFLLGRRSSL